MSWSAYLSGIVGCCVIHIEPVGTMSESGFIGWISVVISDEYHAFRMVGACGGQVRRFFSLEGLSECS